MLKHELKVTLVANVASIQCCATNSIDVLDDGAGRVKAQYWVGSHVEHEIEKWAGIE
jgi:hypothetical protein